MKHTIYTPSVIDAKTEEKLWNDAVIVFDTCALLDLYYMIPEIQEVMTDILTYLSNRIWLPAQVVYEYQKNKDGAMMKPKTERYRDNTIQKNSFVSDLKGLIAQWEREYYHPYISNTSLQAIKTSLQEIEPKIADIKTRIAKEYEARGREIEAARAKDVVASTINTLSHGEPFTFSQLKAICHEGTIRFANQVPPGYKDAENKTGIRRYGDLIIWKEILRYAADKRKDIIFVSNDTVKGDWTIVGEGLKEEQGHPIRELLAEFEEETGQDIWFYKTSDFITKLEALYQPKQTEITFYGKLGQVRDVLNTLEREREIRHKYKGDAILIRCSNCGELFPFHTDDMDFEWDGGVVNDRGMGYEMQYDSNEVCECPNCHEQIDVTLQVWEYPEGAFNYQNIEVDGGDVEEPINLANYIDFGDYETCERCGERAVLNEHGLCEQCEDEFRRFVNSDD